MDRIRRLLSEFTDLHTRVVSRGLGMEDDEWQQASDRGQQIADEYRDLLAALEAIRVIVDRNMEYGAACPFCKHHYIHTTEENRHEWDRKLERGICPYPAMCAALDRARGEES